LDEAADLSSPKQVSMRAGSLCQQDLNLLERRVFNFQRSVSGPPSIGTVARLCRDLLVEGNDAGAAKIGFVRLAGVRKKRNERLI